VGASAPYLRAFAPWRETKKGWFTPRRKGAKGGADLAVDFTAVGGEARLDHISLPIPRLTLPHMRFCGLIDCDMTKEAQQLEHWLNEGAHENVVASALSELGKSLPPSYVNFVRQKNGGEGFVGENYLSLWKIEELAQFNSDYEVEEYAPGFLFFASNGGGDGYAFDTTAEAFPIHIIPFIGMSRKDAIPVSPSFDGFFDALRRDQFWPTPS
jgi:SMI1 / KNR4 family (SUKH-1)